MSSTTHLEPGRDIEPRETRGGIGRAYLHAQYFEPLVHYGVSAAKMLADIVRAWGQRRRTRHELMALDDHMLEDIGLRRDGIEAALRGYPVGTVRIVNEDRPSTATDESFRSAA